MNGKNIKVNLILGFAIFGLARNANHLGIAKTILTHIWALKGNIKELKVSFIWREANRAANYMSKLPTTHPLAGVSMYRPLEALCLTSWQRS